MAQRKILLFPHKILSQHCLPVKINDPSLTSLINDLTDTLYASPGVGLAAPQIGVPKRLSVIDTRRSKRGGNKRIDKSIGFVVLINPTIIHASGIQIPREGCLSIPDLLANVKRYKEVTVRTLTSDGKEKIIKSRGFEALALQHELDHLDGTLFIDRVSNLKTDVFRRSTY